MKKGDLRKQEILDTAEALFCRKGYEQTSIQDILNILGSSKGSFYHHYESKEALLESICRRRAEQIRLTAENAAGSTNSVSESLNILLSGMIPFSSEKLGFLLMLLPIFSMPEGRMVRQAYSDALAEQFLDSVSLCLKNGNHSGELKSEDPRLTADLILSSVSHLWIRICETILASEQKGEETDLSSVMKLVDCYRIMIERMLLLPYGTVELISIPTLKSLADQIHTHWN